MEKKEEEYMKERIDDQVDWYDKKADLIRSGSKGFKEYQSF